MSELRTDFKDEILQEGETHRVYDIKRKGTDEIVESDIYLEKAYTPLQEGDSFGAKEVNEIHGRLNGLAPQNLLINGDFKINQRGQSSYEINNSTWIYSIDLWRINGMKLQVNSDETITLTALNETNYFQQIIENADYQTGDTLILSVYIDGNIKTFNIHIGTTEYIDEKISIFASYNQEQKRIYLSLSINQQSNSVALKWIQLNEGSIAYSHIPEDDATALLRCQDWVIWGEIPSNAPSNMNLTTGVIEARVPFPKKMKSIPTVKVHDLQNNEDRITRVNIGMDSADNSVVSGIVPRNTGFIVTSSGTYSANALSGYYLATREPL